ncbi:type II toxin-antitoxin system RelE/ParE family toxin [Corynebacterium mastitidis]|uniref:type II toxin-antitoxin system RelE family toxin n=1 Tax=Corynebacterium mastitidis TaxID=161890 RepID=UPI0030E8F10B
MGDRCAHARNIAQSAHYVILNHNVHSAHTCPIPKAYTALIARPAEKQLTALSRANKRAYLRVVEAIERLAHDPRPPLVKKLQVSGDWQIRVGHYRVIYTIDDAEVTVSAIRVASRQRAYSPSAPDIAVDERILTAFPY